jgi:N-acetylglucosaminyl-diphospho-decaprenol L-rhamnosyltransferase
MSFSKKITIVIVIYNSTNLIFECLSQLDNFNIIIVDNKNNKKIIEKLKNYKNISIISKNKNLGFGNAINFAIDYIKTELFLVLNPDIVISEKDIFKIYETINKFQKCAIAAPINMPDNDSYGIFPEKRNLYEKNRRLIVHKQESIPENEFCVDVTKGCALLINTNFFKEVDGFSKEYFLFWEEIDLCRKLRKAGYSVIVNPNSIAKHNQGNSSKNSLFNYFLRSYHGELSPLLYFNVRKKNYSLYVKIFKYLLRSFTYLFIFNIKRSIKNFSKFSAIINYILK